MSKASGWNRVVLDWDGTCVASAYPDTGDWMPGAVDAIKRFLKAGFEVMIVSTRLAPTELDEETPRAEGAQAKEYENVRLLLDAAGLHDVRIWDKPWKPGAVVYVDDKARRYNGNKGSWEKLADTILLDTGRDDYADVQERTWLI